MSTSYPYLAFSRRMNVRYGDVLAAVDWIEGNKIGSAPRAWLDMPTEVRAELSITIHREYQRRNKVLDPDA